MCDTSAIISTSEGHTRKIAADFAGDIKSNALNVVLLKGDLGTGKTIFVKGFCEEYGVNESEVKSPTYTYMRKYNFSGGVIYHFDYYRLDHMTENFAEEINEIMEDEKAILLIEWPDRIKRALLPSKRAEIVFGMGKSENERIINISLSK